MLVACQTSQSEQQQQAQAVIVPSDSSIFVGCRPSAVECSSSCADQKSGKAESESDVCSEDPMGFTVACFCPSVALAH
jgi:hypothetical protein